MELDRYKAFICAVETGSLSAAAEKLQYTPSGVSRMIAALEEENGFPLLFRDRNGVCLTPEGEQLLPAVRNLLYAGENCMQVSAKIKGLETGTVVIGTAYSAFYAPLAAAISDFHKKHPGIQIQLCGGYSTELLDKLNAHQIDLCIISKREGNHDWYPMMQDEMMAWLPVDHPLACRKKVPVKTFEKEAYIETYPERDIDNVRVFAKCKVTPNLQFASMDSYATYAMVEAGLGISMNNAINGRAWSGNVKILPLEPKQEVEIGVASLQELSTIGRAFLEYMKENCDWQQITTRV